MLYVWAGWLMEWLTSSQNGHPTGSKSLSWSWLHFCIQYIYVLKYLTENWLYAILSTTVTDLLPSKISDDEKCTPRSDLNCNFSSVSAAVFHARQSKREFFIDSTATVTKFGGRTGPSRPGPWIIQALPAARRCCHLLPTPCHQAGGGVTPSTPSLGGETMTSTQDSR